MQIELFKQLPNVFKKILNSTGRPSDNEALDLLTVNLFPLISQILMTAEDNVQTEGVQALLKISQEFIPKEEAEYLVFNVVNLMVKKASSMENAKVAIMMIMDQFAQSGFFGAKECVEFITQSLTRLADGALFKVKKYMVPCLLSMASHLPYDLFKTQCVSLYLKYMSDPIWGVRRVCLENLSRLVELLRPTESEVFTNCLRFLEESFVDQSKWVKNQAYH